MDLLSVGLQMPRRLQQEIPFVTFHLLSDTPPYAAWLKRNLTYSKHWEEHFIGPVIKFRINKTILVCVGIAVHC